MMTLSGIGSDNIISLSQPKNQQPSVPNECAANTPFTDVDTVICT